MNRKESNEARGLAASRPPPGSQATKDQAHLKVLGWGESNDQFRMDSNKLPWHLQRVQQWIGPQGKFDGRIAPLHIDMGITTGCNLACHFCYGVIQARDGYMGPGGKALKVVVDGEEMGFVGRDKLIHMPLEVITGVFEDAKQSGVRSIALIGEGENTLNKNLYPAIEYARDIQFDVSMATHGANIKEEHVKSLMTSLQWIRINISAATHESYERVHQRPWLDKVMSATQLLVEGKKSKGYRTWRGTETTIGFQMVLTKRNFDQIVPLARLGRDMGVDYTVIKACSDTPERELDAPDKEYLELVDVFKEAESLSEKDGYSVVVRWNKLGNLGNKDYSTCHGTRFIVAVSGDGTVFPCGHWFARERSRFAMGNVNEMRLGDIFKSDRYWQVQEEIHNVDLRMCETNCRQHSCNQSLARIAESEDHQRLLKELEPTGVEPIHVNFV